MAGVRGQGSSGGLGGPTFERCCCQDIGCFILSFFICNFSSIVVKYMFKDPQLVEYTDVELNRQEGVLAEWEAL